MDYSALHSVNMTYGHVLAIVLSILVPLLGVLIWVRKELKSDILDIKNDIKDIRLDIRSIDGRINRLEGAFFERGQWEAKIYKVNKDPPQ